MNIPCNKDTDDLSEREIFLIEKKIESVKKRKIEEAQKAKKKQKIKLKKDVKLSSDLTRRIGKEGPAKENEPKEPHEAASHEVEKVAEGNEGRIKKPAYKAPQEVEGGAEIIPAAETHAPAAEKKAPRPAESAKREPRPAERRESRPETERRDRPRPQGDRPRPYGDRPRPQGDRPQGDRPRPYGDRPRPQGDRPQGGRPQGGGRGQGRPMQAREGGQRGDIRKKIHGPGGKDEAPVAIEIDDQALKVIS